MAGMSKCWCRYTKHFPSRLLTTHVSTNAQSIFFHPMDTMSLLKWNTASFRKKSNNKETYVNNTSLPTSAQCIPGNESPSEEYGFDKVISSGKCVRNATMMAMAFTTSRYLLFTICFILKIRIFGEPYGPIHTFRDGNLSADAAHGHTP